MIRRLRLHNWRSYEDLDVELDPGTTFVVAPNGVGKTSLVYGLAWGVFGQHSKVDPKPCIRAGSDNAQVRVEFDLPDERRFSIVRTVKRRGAPTATYELEGKGISENSAQIAMEQALGIDLPAASGLSMMMGGGHIAASGSLDLESHLHHAFGVAHLLDAAEKARVVAREAERTRTSLRSTTRQRMDNRSATESEIARLEGEITLLQQRGSELERIRDSAAAQRTLVERHEALAGQLDQYERRRSHLMSDIENLMGRSVTTGSNESIRAEMLSELEACERKAVEVTEGSVNARSVINASDHAILLLDDDHGICPTCMRSLPAHERASAISAHRTQRVAAQAETRRIEEIQTENQTRARTISRLLGQLESLQPPNLGIKESDFPTRAEADTLYQQAIDSFDEHNRQLGGVQSQLKSLRAQIASDDQVQEEERNLRLAYRREAVAYAGAEVLREAAEHVIKSRIEPMAAEVRGRWKHLFTSNGLAFGPDGSITRVRDGEELDWDTLSGGERTWARIVTHLIVMATTTSLPFAWFDEPLEYLDPQLRHAVAATLATATRGGSPRQLLVTTYEHAIAQQLANETDGAEIITIRESSA